MKAVMTIVGLLLCLGAQAESPTPVCQNQRQCQAMWSAAQLAVGTATGMLVRTVTDSRIETFPASDATLLTGVVTKVPSGQEGYKILIDLSCYAATKCEDKARAGTELFNTLVINAGADLGPLPATNTADRIATTMRAAKFSL